MNRIYMMNKRPRSYGIDLQLSEEQVAEMQALASKFSLPKTRSLTMGKVTRTTDTEVWIDVGGKAEGVLPAEEFKLRGFGQEIHVGDTVEVWLQEAWGSGTSASDKDKYSSISFAKAAQMRSWRTLEAHFKNRKLIDGIILGKTAGGYVISLVEYGARAFLPLSQADPQMSRSNEILQKYKTEIHQYLIIRIERSGNVVVSRREVMLADSGGASLQSDESGASAPRPSSSDDAKTEGGANSNRTPRPFSGRPGMKRRDQ